jgi:RNA polymerase sigma factor (sigma-70 family)
MLEEAMSDLLLEQFQAERPRLQAVAYRITGSAAEADDALQEAWLRLSRSDTAEVENLSGWLTTVVARICLGILRTHRTRREEPIEADTVATPAPDAAVVEADLLGPALVMVLDTLSPAERLAFVLHDLFALPFDDIAPILDRSAAAARQLASRARRRVQGNEEVPPADRHRQEEIVTAFLAASRGGDFHGLLNLLDPDVVMRADRKAVEGAAANRGRGAPELAAAIRGREAVAATMSGRAAAAQLVTIDGMAGAAWAPGGQPRLLFAFQVEGGTITEIELIADPEVIAGIEAVVV